MWWHVWRRRKIYTGLWLGRLQEDYMEDGYKWENSFKIDVKWDGKPWIGSSGKGHGQVMACCAHGREHFGSIKCEESIDYQWDCLLLKKDTAPLSKHDTLI
jgi:hypothetical protein